MLLRARTERERERRKERGVRWRERKRKRWFLWRWMAFGALGLQKFRGALCPVKSYFVEKVREINSRFASSFLDWKIVCTTVCLWRGSSGRRRRAGSGRGGKWARGGRPKGKERRRPPKPKPQHKSNTNMPCRKRFWQFYSYHRRSVVNLLLVV